MMKRLNSRRVREGCLASALLVLVTVAAAQRIKEFEEEPPRQWMPPLMGDPTKLSPDRYVNDEYPSVAFDRQGRLWVAWSSCRPGTEDWPGDDPSVKEWEWPDNGQDSIVVRSFDGKGWSDEQIVSTVAGVNHKPTVVADSEGIRVLWTARRRGCWAAYERRWNGGGWSQETRLPESGDTLEIRARQLGNGNVLAVLRKLVPPRIELHTSLFSAGGWEPGGRLDEGQGRCFRPHLLALPGGQWLVAWDEERGGNYDIYARHTGGEVEQLRNC